MRFIVTFLLVMMTVAFAQSPGDVIIVEIMKNPQDVSDSDGEWFEVFNNTPNQIDFNGWRIADAGTGGDTVFVTSSAIAEPFSHFVFGRNGNTAENGDYTADYVYGDGFILANATDEIHLAAPDGLGGFTTIDTVNYDGTHPSPNGRAVVFTGNLTADNNNGALWAETTVREAGYSLPAIVGISDDSGSPGTLGSDGGLSVQLYLFAATGQDGQVSIKWTTASESNNLGFAIQRATERGGEYTEIASYQNNADLEGQFNTNAQTEYAFIDRNVANSNTYWYKLVDINANGERTEHGPISAKPQGSGSDLTTIGVDVPQDFQLHQNYPNPFNPSTTLRFDVPDTREELSPVTVEIFNTLGQKVKTLYNDAVQPGVYEVVWDATSDAGNVVPAGVYIAIMKSDQVQQTIKMALIK